MFLVNSRREYARERNYLQLMAIYADAIAEPKPRMPSRMTKETLSAHRSNNAV